MALKANMQSLLNMQWTTMLVENRRNQERLYYLHRHLLDNTSAKGIVDYSQTWHNTPQGRDYWMPICSRL